MPFTHRFERDSKIGRVMALLAKPEGATLREIAAAYGDPDAPDATVIRDILKQRVSGEARVKLQVDLRTQRVRTTDSVRMSHVADLAELVVAGHAVEADFSLRTAYAEVLGPDDRPAQQAHARQVLARPNRLAAS